MASMPNHPYGGDLREDSGESLSNDGAEYLQQEIEVAEEIDLAKKTAICPTVDLQHVDAAEERIRRLDLERAEMVAKRRQHTNPVVRAFSRFIPYGGILSSGFSLASSSIGAGIISLPSAFQMSGLIMGLIYMVIIAYLMVFSYTLLGIAGKKTGLRNYEQIVFYLLGNGADYLLAFMMWVFSFGTAISYVISMQDALVVFLDASDTVPAYLKSVSGHRLLTSMVWLAFMLPPTLPKEINSLRYFSFFAILFIVFFVICMIVHAAQNGLKHGPRKDLVYFQTGNTAIQGLAIFIFAFISQLNCYEVYAEMHKPSVRRLTQGAGIGVSLTFVLYFLAGLFGYLDFGPKVVGSSLKLYDPVHEPLMAVAYVGIMLKLCVGYGLHMIPVRDAIYHVVRVDVRKIAWWKNAMVCGSMATLSLIAGLFIPRINMIFGLVGGFSGGFIAFIFPALMYMYCGHFSLREVGWHHYFGTYFLLIVGVIGVVWGTASSIYSEVIAERGG